jgi:hypothetical protein
MKTMYKNAIKYLVTAVLTAIATYFGINFNV